MGADTGELSKSFIGINKSLGETQKSLNDVNRLLKLDPKNTELLAQKQGLLTKQIEQSSDKLKQLKATLSDINSGKATISAGGLDALKREIVSSENEVKKLQAEFKKLDTAASASVKNIAGGFKSAGDKMTSIGTAMTKNVTAPILAAVGTIGAAYKSVDAGMDAYAQKTGKTGEEVKAAFADIKNIASDTGLSYEVIGNALGQVETVFQKTGKAGAELAAQFAQFAYVNKVDVSQAIDAVGHSLTAFGEDMNKAAHMVDLYNKIGQDTGYDSLKLAQDVEKNAATFKALNMSSENAAIALGKFHAAGLDVDAVMSGLNKLLAESVERYKTANKARDSAIESARKEYNATASQVEKLKTKLAELQCTNIGGKNDGKIFSIGEQLKQAELEAEQAHQKFSDAVSAPAPVLQESREILAEFFQKAKDGSLTAQDAIDTFGAKTASALLLTAQQGKISMSDLYQSMDGVAGNVAKMSEQMQGPEVEFNKVLQTVKGDLYEVATELLPVLLEAFKLVAPIIVDIAKRFAEWIKSMDKTKQMAVVIGGAIAAAAGPIIVAIGAITAAIGSVGTAISGIMVFVGKLGIMAMLAKLGAAVQAVVALIAGASAPVVAAIAAVVAIVAAAVYAFKNWDAISKTVSSTISQVTSTFSGVIDTVLAKIKTFAEYAGNTLSDVANYVVDSLGELWDSAEAIYDSAAEWLEAEWNLLLEQAGNIFNDIYEAIRNAFYSAVDAVKNAMSNIYNSVVDNVNGAIAKIRELLSFSSKASGGSYDFSTGAGVRFHADAMQNGTILTSPTIFQYNGRLHGAGEAGPEAVVGVSSLREMITSAVKSATSSGGDITIPVYLGNEKLQEFVVKANRRQLVMSGGR